MRPCDCNRAGPGSGQPCRKCGCHPLEDVRCDAHCACGYHHFDPIERVLVSFFDRMHGDKAYRRHDEEELRWAVAAVSKEVAAILATHER